MKDKKVVLLGSKGVSTSIVFNAVNSKFGVHLAIIEEKESTVKFLKRRIKRLGLFTVIGQILFQLLIAKPLDIFSKKRMNEIVKENELNLTAIPTAKLMLVNSVNSEATKQKLKEVDPDLIIVNGTRIISKKVLNCVNCKFINTHAGITPKYRGVHGTYWALVNNDIENSGVTIHFVDEGIDTGNIIDQVQVTPVQKDNFSTYPLLQLSAGISILLKAIEDYFDNRIILKQRSGESRLWYHPTINQYIYYRILNKVK